MSIENALQQILKPYPEGIYIKGNELPSITPDEYFYRMDRVRRDVIKEVQVRSIDDVTGHVYNEDGDIIILDRIALNKTRLLSTLPTVPAYGREVARAAVQDLLDHLQIYKNVGGTDRKYLQQVFETVINPIYHDQKTYRQFEDLVERACDDFIYKEIMAFSKGRTWDILVPKFDRDTIKVENKGDYRIHRYMEEHGHEHNLSRPKS
jgi:hypothetical protein